MLNHLIGRSHLADLGRQAALGIEKKSTADRHAYVVAKHDRLGAAQACFDESLQAAIVIAWFLRTSVTPRRYGVYQHGHASATDQAVIPTIIVIEREGHHLGLAAGRQDCQGALLDLRLDAAAPQRAALAAVRKHEHGGARLLWR